MPWYYAGPEAKPVGPISLEELQARRRSGVIASETYVIEHTGRSDEAREWKRYRDLFPAEPALSFPPPVPPPVPPSVPAHPLFPSAAVSPSYAPSRPINGMCLWGFLLGLFGFFPFSFMCIGALPALAGFFLSLFGFLQVRKTPSQSGRGLAIWGMVLSVVAILIALVISATLISSRFQADGMTLMEQSTNDSD